MAIASLSVEELAANWRQLEHMIDKAAARPIADFCGVRIFCSPHVAESEAEIRDGRGHLLGKIVNIKP